ncbi:nonsense-mediated mRNA decay protein 2 [Drosophila serrata]|uniref:nonsense-mediated mRNA decay protein 2 n=1 Tax=Drosophila serrata TaxID=7274 RepID=UPI000A1D08A2|nr:nonsense-mediated mRNA decay protein 2 [Drosophila serrata]
MADVEAEEEVPLEQQPGQDEGEADETLEGEDEDEPEGEEEEELSSGEEKDPFELLDESESDDEEEQAMYKEYLDLIKEIDAQNLVIHDLKAMATELRCKRCKTYKDKEEYKHLRICQEQHDIHLQQLINRATRLQNFGSRRLYGELEMELTDAEESFFFTGLASTSLTACATFKDEENCCNRGCPFCWESDSDSDSKDYDPACWTDF